MSRPPVVTANKRKWFVMTLITLVAAGVISYFASPHPDGLERVAEDHGFIEKAAEPSWVAWISDYEVPGIPFPIVKVGLAGIIGVALMFLVLYGLTATLTRREEDADVGKDKHHPSGEGRH